MKEITDVLKQKFIEIAKKTIIGDIKWVLFSNGTFILVKDKVDNLQEATTNFLTEFGPVVPATPMGDFSILDLKDGEGWLITSWKQPMLTIVLKEEFDNESEIDDMSAGTYGRTKRGMDAKHPEILFIME